MTKIICTECTLAIFLCLTDRNWQKLTKIGKINKNSHETRHETREMTWNGQHPVVTHPKTFGNDWKRLKSGMFVNLSLFVTFGDGWPLVFECHHMHPRGRLSQNVNIVILSLSIRTIGIRLAKKWYESCFSSVGFSQFLCVCFRWPFWLALTTFASSITWVNQKR